jgi:hypothetical protein
MNRTIEDMLAKLMARQEQWEEYLPFCLMAYRSTKHDTTGVSPNMMMLGREIELPLDLVVGGPVRQVTENNGASPFEYVESLRDGIELSHEIARETTKKNSERQKRYYDRQRFDSAYKVGDVVWCFNNARKKGVCPKLQCHWKGPFMVIGKIDDVVYRLQKTSHTKPIVCHYDRLKPYRGLGFKKWDIRPKTSDNSELVRSKDSFVQRNEQEIHVDVQETGVGPEQRVETQNTDNRSGQPLVTLDAATPSQVNDEFEGQIETNDRRQSMGRPQRAKKPPLRFGDWVERVAGVRWPFSQPITSKIIDV